MNELMINTQKELVRQANNNKGGGKISESRLSWIMETNIIVEMSELIEAVAKHDPIAVLPGQKTKTYAYCDCLAD